MDTTSSTSHRFTVRVQYSNSATRLVRILKAIDRAGGTLEAMDVVRTEQAKTTRDLTVGAQSEENAGQIVAALKRIRGVHTLHASDRVFLLHLGGKLSIRPKMALTTRDAVSMAYTPGVSRVMSAIVADKEAVNTLTIKANSVAVVSDGSAVPGLGNVGPEAVLPLMEGKAMLFKEFASIDAYPICLATQDIGEIVSTLKNIAVGFGGISLECFSSPRCFQIEEKLKKSVDVPVFHDGQHGTAVVALAVLINALKVAGKSLATVRILVMGAGAAGKAVVQLLLAAGARHIICCDRGGSIHKGRLPHFDAHKTWLACYTNREGLIGNVEKAATGRDVFIGVSAPDAFSIRALKKMAPNPIVIALANPEPEISVASALKYTRLIASSSRNCPNQIHSLLAFPGIFRGALDVRAREINGPMKLAAARAIAACVSDGELSEEYLVPGLFNRRVCPAVARAVVAAARSSGVARRNLT